MAAAVGNGHWAVIFYCHCYRLLPLFLPLLLLLLLLTDSAVLDTVVNFGRVKAQPRIGARRQK